MTKNKMPPTYNDIPGCYIFPETKPDPEKVKKLFQVLMSVSTPKQQKIIKKAMKKIEEMDNEDNDY